MMRHWFVLIVACCLICLPANAQDELPPDGEAEPLHQPVPDYPFIATLFGVSAYCEVTFGVDEEGYTFGLYPSCTNFLFCNAARRAINEVRFKPKYENGRPEVRTNIVYPLVFVMHGQSPDDIDRSRLSPCQTSVNS